MKTKQQPHNSKGYLKENKMDMTAKKNENQVIQVCSHLWGCFKDIVEALLNNFFLLNI